MGFKSLIQLGRVFMEGRETLLDGSVESCFKEEETLRQGILTQVI